MKMLEKLFGNTVPRIVVLTILSAAVLLVFASSSSILFQWYGGDYVVFRTLGQGWLDGCVPYHDLFDHKGPLMYLIQLAGLLIHPGKYGIWFLELLGAVVTFELIFRIGRKLGASDGLVVLSVFAGLIFLAAYVDGGNTVEQWSLPFQLVALYAFMKYYRCERSLASAAVICGACFGAVSLIRINDNGVVCGIVVGLAVYFLVKKRFSDLGKACCFFLLGLFLSVLPFIVYFSVSGGLRQFFYCNFIFNMHYKAVWDGGFSMQNVANNFICLSSCVILPAVVAWQKKIPVLLRLVFISVAVITLLTFLTGAAYSHYFLMAIPVAALCVQCACHFNRYMKMLVFLAVVLPVIYRNQGLPALRMQAMTDHMASEKVLSQTELFGCIPLADIDSVYAFGEFSVSSQLSRHNALPIGKYFFIQQKLSAVDETISADIQDAFFKASPKWVASSCDLTECRFFNGFDSLYDCVAEPDDNKEHCFVYRKNESHI